jgi:prepilin-type N-terminal cleavage/methylation domain-containing protein
VVVTLGARQSQRGLTLVELVLATAISAILMASINQLVKLGLDAQASGRGTNELTFQGRVALERISDKARATAPAVLVAPATNTTGTWFAPTMFCRNASNQLIETTTADTTCTGTSIIASNVTTFSASLPVDMGPVDRSIAVVNLTLADSSNNTISLSSSIRLGGGTQ